MANNKRAAALTKKADVLSALELLTAPVIHVQRKGTLGAISCTLEGWTANGRCWLRAVSLAPVKALLASGELVGELRANTRIKVATK